MTVSVGDHRLSEDSDIEPESLKQLLEALQVELDLPVGDIEVSLVNDQQISTINSEYRKLDKPTNVLSFPQYNWSGPGICIDNLPVQNENSPPLLWGEIIVSCETVARQADQADKPFCLELVRMCLHGMLHLFGYDHITDEDYQTMHLMEVRGMQFVYNYWNSKQP